VQATPGIFWNTGLSKLWTTQQTVQSPHSRPGTNSMRNAFLSLPID
jgi:hypothetical protein